MKCEVSEIAADVYRLSTFHPDYGIQFNQFIIKDEEPFLMHTGFKKSFPVTLDGVKTILDPQKLRWIGFSHFESDECGALNEWLNVAPQAQAVCSFVGAVVTVDDFADRPSRPLNNDEVLEIGRRRLRFLATPHVPHGWDAGMFFEEVDQTLLCSDLFFQPGQQEPLIETGVVERARESIITGLQGPLAKDMPYTPDTEKTLRRLAELKPQTLAIMHGSSYRGDGQKALNELTEVIKELLSGSSEPR
jgi:flavorubredoxin